MTALDSRLIVSGTWILDTLSCIPKSKVQDSGTSQILDCKTVSFFPSKSAVFSFVPDLLFYCSRVLEYAKIRTVLQPTRIPESVLPSYIVPVITPYVADNDKICWFTVKSPDIRVMSPEMFSQVARNAELCGSKFYHAQQYPGIPITICRACFF